MEISAAQGIDFPRGESIGAESAATRLDEWFPEGPGEGCDVELLADMCMELGGSPRTDLAPLSPRRLKEIIREALLDRRLVAARIRMTTPASRRVELETEEPKPPEVVKHWIEFQIKDERGNPVSGPDWVMTRDGGLVEQGKLADGIVHRVGVKKGRYVFEVKTLTRATWDRPLVKIGEAVKLTASVTGFPKDTAGQFEIFDARAVGKDALATANGTVNAEATLLEAAFTPSEEALVATKSGALVCRAKIGALHATSVAVPIHVKYEISFENAKGDPLGDTQVVVRFAGGTCVRKSSNAGKLEVWAPLGESLFSIDVAGHRGARVGITGALGDRQYIAPEVDKT